MDFFERLFGVSPDAGRGTLEAACISALVLIFLIPVVLPVVLRFLKHSRRVSQRS
jgi:hypothetical protein